MVFLVLRVLLFISLAFCLFSSAQTLPFPSDVDPALIADYIREIDSPIALRALVFQQDSLAVITPSVGDFLDETLSLYTARNLPVRLISKQPYERSGVITKIFDYIQGDTVIILDNAVLIGGYFDDNDSPTIWVNLQTVSLDLPESFETLWSYER